MTFELSFAARNVLLGAALLGGLGGALGSFALLRRQSLLGDALAHAALPGVCLGFLVSGVKAPLPLFIGALLAGLLGSLFILATIRNSRIKEDTAIGIVLSVFFGVGIVLLTYIQKLPTGNQSGLDRFLFGQAATLMAEDVTRMGWLGGAVLAVMLLTYKELKVLSFDPEFGASLGLPIRRLEMLLTLLLVVVVVVGLQTVGVVLIVATLITPAAAARQWTESLGRMIVLAGVLGATAGVLGAMASATVDRLPTGPSIVIVSSVVLVGSLLFAPQRGIAWAILRERRLSRRIRRENLLKDIYRIGEDHPARASGRSGWDEFIPAPRLMGVRGQSAPQLAKSARPLVTAGLLETSGRRLRLTAEGLEEAARVVRKHRLWELYLTRKLELASDHVHREAEAMEHALTDEAVAALEAKLGWPRVDPHGRAIPPAPDLAPPAGEDERIAS
ncbi:MAG: iron chelate uptake ABC transporter family permease subunit [Acidobacteriota bacterium]